MPLAKAGTRNRRLFERSFELRSERRLAATSSRGSAAEADMMAQPKHAPCRGGPERLSIDLVALAMEKVQWRAGGALAILCSDGRLSRAPGSAAAGAGPGLGQMALRPGPHPSRDWARHRAEVVAAVSH